MTADVEKGTIGGLPYFHVARSYPDGATAAHMFERLDEMGKRNRGKLDLGVYRLIPHGIGDEATIIAIVSFGRRGVEFAAKVMGGEPTDAITPEDFDAMMARRAQVVAPVYAAGGAKHGGHVRIKRGKRGAWLRPDGTVDERIGEG